MTETNRVRVRSAYPFDAERIFAWRTEESVRRYQPMSDQGLEALRRELATTPEELAAEEGRRFCWIVEAPRPVGWLTLSVVSWRHGLAEIGYSLTADAQGHGIMRQALPQVLEILFSRTSLYRIEARCDLRNEASIRLLEAVGFRREGVLRDYFVLDGERRDNVLYAVLRREWREQC